MSITHLSTLTQSHGPGGRRAAVHERFGNLRAGQSVRVKVLHKLDATRYEVRLGAERHIVESSIELLIGKSLQTTVVAVGEQLELRYSPEGGAELIDSAGRPVEADDRPEPAGQDIVSVLAQQYRLSLAPDDNALLRNAVVSVPDRQAMAKAGLYLARLGLPLGAPALSALYGRQMRDEFSVSDSAVDAVVDGSDLMTVQETADRTLSLQAVLQSALPQTESQNGLQLQLTSDGPGDGHDGRRGLAQWLLNVQDGGRVGYRFGTLPLLVGGRLTEIDLALFQDRRPQELPHAERRFVMTLRTDSLGAVRIAATALGTHLTVEIGSDSSEGLQCLLGNEAEFRRLLAELGWTVDAMSCRSSAGNENAAQVIIDHVLLGGSVNQHL